MKLHVLTAVTRPANLPDLEQSIARAAARASHVDVWWHHRRDPDRQHVGGQQPKNRMLELIDDGWVCVLDDDTIMHPRFLRRIYRTHIENPDAQAIVVSQKRTTGVVLEAAPENMVVGMVDAGQVILKRSLIGDTMIPETYAGDGEWIETLLAGRDDVVYLKEVLSLHNALTGVDVSETPERMGA